MLGVEDIVEINQLMSLYGHLADAAKFTPVDSPAQQRLAEVFTDDAEYDATLAGGPMSRGLAEIRGMFSTPKPSHPPAHQCTNVYVYEEDGVVRVASKWIISDWDHGVVAVGKYQDVVVRQDGGWRIKQKVALLDSGRPAENTTQSAADAL
jgi:hypothetical protein